MAVDLKEVRAVRDHLTGTIIGGLRERRRYSLNQGVFTEPFDGISGPTWYEWRLKRDQDTDSASGRYLFEDQTPILFKVEELEKPGVKRNPPKLDLIRLETDISDRVITLYKNFLPRICKPGENPHDYGATIKRDVDNILTLCERTESIGREVATAKIADFPNIVYLASKEDIKHSLRNPEIEEYVLAGALDTARRYNIPRPACILPFFRKIISLTVDVEIECVRAYQKSKGIDFGKSHEPISWSR